MSERQSRSELRSRPASATAGAARPASRTIRQLVLASASLVLAVLAIALGAIWQDRRYTIANALADASDLADALAAQTDETLGRVDRSLLSLVRAIDPDDMARPDRRERVVRLLRDRDELNPDVFSFFVVDAKGDIVASSRTSTPAENLSDQPAFKAHRDDPALGMRINAPLIAPYGGPTGQWILAFSRRLDGPGGSFNGVVVAVVLLDEFMKFHRALNVGAAGTVGLFRSDGMLIARHPFEPRLVGRSYEAGSLFSIHLQQAPNGTYAARFISDGVDRLTAYRTVQDKNVVVYVAVAENEVLAQWNERAAAVALLGAILIAAIAAFTVAMQRSLLRREREQQAAAARLAALAEVTVELSSITDFDALLDKTAERVRALVGAHQAVVRLTEGAHTVRAISVSGKYADLQKDKWSKTPFSLYDLVRQQNRPLRMTQAEMEAHPLWHEQPTDDGAPRMRGWLAVPLVDRDGHTLGAVQLSEKVEGDFTAEDESIVVQLARTVSIAVENVRLIDSLRSAEKRFQDFADVSSDWLWETDERHRFTFFAGRRNPAASSLAGEMMGIEPWLSAVGPSDDAIRAEHRRLMEEHQTFRDLEYTRLDAKRRLRHVSISGRPVVDAAGRFKGYRGTATDLTERREAEDRLRQSQKMEAVGQLTGGVAHDFNNLLTVIIGNAEALEETPAATEAQRRMAEAIRITGERGAALTNRLLAFSRRQTLQPRTVDVNVLLSGMDGLLRRTLGEAIEVEWVRGAGVWQTLVDPGQLENALLNLAINARDAMPAGGKLTIETGNAFLDQAYADTEPDVRPGQYVMVAVADSGHGMSTEVVARAFEPFFTTKEAGKGTGLGLSMIYGFVKQSGGHVKIYSEVGQGTIIRLYLPRAAGAALEAEARREAGPAPTGTETILVVEDEAAVREYVETQLTRLGYRVIAASDGPAALAALRRDEGIALLFTDIVMPGGMNGRQLAEAATGLRPGLKVLYTSGYTENVVVHHGRLDPGIRLLNKPYRTIDLARSVRAALDES